MHILTKKRQVLSMSKKAFFKGTFLLTCAGLLSRVIGFFYRIFLSHTIGAEGIGLFQLAIPLQTLLLAVTASGIQTALSRLVAAHLATGEDKKARDFFCLGTFFAFALSCMVSALLYLRADFFAVQILALKYPELVDKMTEDRNDMRAEVALKGEKLAKIRAMQE